MFNNKKLSKLKIENSKLETEISKLKDEIAKLNDLKIDLFKLNLASSEDLAVIYKYFDYGSLVREIITRDRLKRLKLRELGLDKIKETNRKYYALGTHHLFFIRTKEKVFGEFKYLKFQKSHNGIEKYQKQGFYQLKKFHFDASAFETPEDAERFLPDKKNFIVIETVDSQQ